METEVLSNHLWGLVEPYKINCFLSGLREDISFIVCMHNPQTVNVAVGLAKMQEENVSAYRKVVKVGTLPQNLAISPPPPKKSAIVPI